MQTDRISTLTSGFACAASGALIGVAIPDYLDSPLRLTAACVGALCLVLVATLTVVSRQTRATAEVRRAIESSVEETAAQATDLSNVVSLRLAESSEQISDSLQALEDRVGIEVSYQSVEQINARESVLLDPVHQLITNAEVEILVLDIVTNEGERPDYATGNERSKDYLTGVIAHVRRTNSLVYRRVCQTNEPQSIAKSVDTAFREHCFEMCRLREEVGQRVALEVTPVQYPYKFVLIDGHTLILQLHRIADSGRPTVWCEIVVSDPRRDIIQPFMDMWADVADSPQTRTITRDDFQVPKSPPKASRGAPVESSAGR